MSTVASFAAADPANAGSCGSGDSLEFDTCGTLPDCCTLYKTRLAVSYSRYSYSHSFHILSTAFFELLKDEEIQSPKL